MYVLLKRYEKRLSPLTNQGRTIPTIPQKPLTTMNGIAGDILMSDPHCVFLLD